MPSQFALLKTRRFLPLFITQFLGAVNDYLLKTALVVMLAYGFLDTQGIAPKILVSVSAAVFIVPFIMFCTFSGTLADKFDKARVTQILKVAEVMIVIIAILGLYSESLFLSFSALFALGVQSAFFAPCKYSLPPQHLEPQELLGGNGLLSTGTYIAILAGTILGTILVPLEHGKFLICSALFVFACAGLGASLYIPPAPPERQNIKIYWNILVETAKIILYAARMPFGIFVGILSVSWFHLIAGTYHTQLPNFAKFTLGVDPFVLSVFMMMFSIGIAVGGLMNNKILKSRVDIRYVPWAGVAIFILSVDLFFLSHSFSALQHGDILNMHEFLSNFAGARILLDLFLIAVAGGLYIVPLRALVQQRSPPAYRARIIAASAVCDASFILISVLISTLLIGMGVKIEMIFMLIGLATLGVAVLISRSKTMRMIFDPQFDRSENS
jgi:acyl-[acyl-carrier-protein]-phospholipid O-acyltransferase/long-chain-fatty-acid--[acyl-carrier-protein] ligase